MTRERAVERASIPFLVRRSEPIPPSAARRLRYDPVRQLSQVEVNGCWIDAADAPTAAAAGTRLTRVNAESTDDE